LCTTAVCHENRTAVVTAHPEIMTLVYKEKEDLFSALNPFDAVMAGPGMGGMGNNRETFEIVSQLLQQAEVPLVLDADALNALQGELKLLERPRRHPRHPVIITPHPGEFARLTGRTAAEIRQGRILLSREFALRYNVYVVLKGHHTIIAAPEEKGGRVFVNPTGNPGMATAGSGDVLSGIITGMICRYIKKYDLETILQAAVFIHGFAGDLAAREIGEISLTAGDIIDYLPAAFLALEKNDYQLPFNIS
jgi:NAD(P)H-hydrate epimerase